MRRFLWLSTAAAVIASVWFGILTISSSPDRTAFDANRSRELHEGSAGKADSTRSEKALGQSVATQHPGDDRTLLREKMARAISEAENRTGPARYEIQAEEWQRIANEFPVRNLGAVLRELASLERINPTRSARDLALRILQRYAEFDVRAAAET